MVENVTVLYSRYCLSMVVQQKSSADAMLHLIYGYDDTIFMPTLYKSVAVSAREI